MEWNVELLGGLRLHAQGRTVTRFRTQRAASLLAYLCFYPHQHARDTLADLFWPETDHETARTNLRQALSQIRTAIKAAGLIPDTLFDSPGKNTIGIDTRYIHTDVAAFLQAVANGQTSLARQLYRGPLLPGLWDDWLLEERDRLEALYQSLATSSSSSTETPASLPLPFLPLPLSRFWGRRRELAQLHEWVLPQGGSRLVTLLGIGGIGKTRLALAAAQRLCEPFRERVGFVPLGALTESRLLLLAILTELAVPAQHPDEDPLEQLSRYLGTEPYLMVLDNLEQLASTVAAPLQTLLTRLPNLTCLVTSRQRLGLEGERLLTVGALDLDASVSLFCDRSGISPNDSLERLCTLLEGIPLALELAANRVGTLTLGEMIEKIDERLKFLTSQERDKTARHHSLHAVMDWSIRLLTSEQRRFFAALSVFRGGWTTEAAATIANEPAALEYLSQLRDRSLITTEEKQGMMRWQMSESLREFGESLLTSSEQEALRLSHCAYFLTFARTNQRALLGNEVAIHQKYEAELANFRFALTAQSAQQAVGLLAELVNFFITANLLREAAAWSDRISPQIESGSRELATFLTRSIVLYYYLRRFDDAVRVGVQGIALLRSFGERTELAQALCTLSYIYGAVGQSEKVGPLLEEALLIGQQENNPTITAECQSALGKHYYHLGQFDASLRYSQDALASARTLNRTNLIATLLNALAITYLHCGDYTCAKAACDEAIALGESLKQDVLLIGDYKVRAVISLGLDELPDAIGFAQKTLRSALPDRHYLDLRDGFSLLAQIRYRDRKLAEVAQWIGACQILQEQHALPEPDLWIGLEAIAANVREGLGDALFEENRACGYKRPFDDTIALALHFSR